MTSSLGRFDVVGPAVEAAFEVVSFAIFESKKQFSWRVGLLVAKMLDVHLQHTCEHDVKARKMCIYKTVQQFCVPVHS